MRPEVFTLLRTGSFDFAFTDEAPGLKTLISWWYIEWGAVILKNSIVYSGISNET